MLKRQLTNLVITGLAVTIFSCQKTETNDVVPMPLDTKGTSKPAPQDTVTSFMVFFSNPIDSSAEVGTCEDPDGNGPIPALIGGVTLKPNTNYIVTFFIEDATNPNNIVYLHKKIEKNGHDYKVCLSNPLGLTIKAEDSDGHLPIGLVNDLKTTSFTGRDNMNITVKYQKNVKNGDCAPGEVFYNFSLPLFIE